MRTLRVYTYNELDDAAKQRAVENSRYKVGEILSDHDSVEYGKAMKTIEDALNIDVYDWEVGYRDYHRWRPTWQLSYDIEDPKMLCRYLERVYYNTHHGKYIGWHKGKHKAYYSKVLSGVDSFSPNGDWTDSAIQHAMEHRYEAVRRGKTIEDFINHLLDEFFTRWGADYEYSFSDEGVRDQLEYNDYFEFYGDGTLYN